MRIETTNTGGRNPDNPSARIPIKVTIKLIALIIEEAPATCKDTQVKSTLIPETPTVDKGG